MENKTGVTLTQKEAEEYCAYKRQKKISEIMAAMRQSGSLLAGEESAVKLRERCLRLHQISVRMTPLEVEQKGELFRNSPLKMDCVVGGNGETFLKVKAYEAKQAIRAGAKEITLVLTPSYLAACRYAEIKKELRCLRRVAGKIPLKARVEKSYPYATLSRVARICSEAKIAYLSLPHSLGCERLQNELLGGCGLEVFGVETLADFKKMAGAGARRIVTSHAWEIYTEWLKEVEDIGLKTEKEKQTPLPSATSLLLPPVKNTSA